MFACLHAGLLVLASASASASACPNIRMALLTLGQAAERAGLVAEVECAQEASVGRVWFYIVVGYIFDTQPRIPMSTSFWSRWGD